jgi:hypothetical protein
MEKCSRNYVKQVVLCVSVEYRRSNRKRFPFREIPHSAEIQIPLEHLSPECSSSLETQSTAGDSLLCHKSHLTRKLHSGEELLRCFTTTLEKTVLREILLEEIQGYSAPVNKTK